MITKEKQNIIQRLSAKDRKTKLYPNTVPDEYKDDKDIINTERQLGMRVVINSGYDVISQLFFVTESVLVINKYDEKEWDEFKRTFEDFNSYYDYLNGDIYNNACYYQYDPSKLDKEIDKSRFYAKSSLIDYCIDDYKYASSIDEETEYENVEKIKKQIKKWIDKFVCCDSFEALFKTAKSYERSALSKKYEIGIEFFFWHYVNFDINDKNRFEIIMKYMSTDYNPSAFMIRPLCHIYEPKEVLNSYIYSEKYTLVAKSTYYQHRRKLKNYVEQLNHPECFEENSYWTHIVIGENYQARLKSSESIILFDSKTHYYYEKNRFGVRKYYESFNEMIRCRHNDLSNAYLINDIKNNYDFSKCKTNENTRLPNSNAYGLRCVVEKEYADSCFRVRQTWYDSSGNVIKKYNHKFEYFFDFVAFLKGDLSNADLIMCEGLKNILDASDIDFTNAEITSQVCDKMGIKYRKYKMDIRLLQSFEETEEQENNTKPILVSSRELSILDDYDNPDNYLVKVSYISDLHLLHKMINFQAKSEADVIFVIQSIVKTIVKETGDVLLIGGDVSSDYEIFKLFIKMLRKELDRHDCDTTVIFVLGNHELWGFPQFSFDKIVDKYDHLISESGMYLLQNSIIFMTPKYSWRTISAKELADLSGEEINQKIGDSNMVFFGGLAFSGYNEEFNANNGIYRNTISRSQEINESRYSSDLYKKVLNAIPEKQLVVFTHTPMDCWREEVSYNRYYLYVSGHTHRNQFYDDGETRIYADNQIGYNNNSPHLKFFELYNEPYESPTYDIFSDYEDGIYQISKDDYIRFYRGKNIMITFNREINVLYMLKKNGYYCFIHQSKNGSLTMLNGGALKKLDNSDIQYYYDNMAMQIAMIADPLEKYTRIQKQISEEIRRIGGSGTIHGCIVDIDWYNHVYVNPEDNKITVYWASDIINKKVYSSVPALLEKECPAIFIRYQRLLKQNSKDLPILASEDSTEITESFEWYFDTMIYNASREIKKMQRLNSKILTTWYEISKDQKMIEGV